MKIKKTNQKTSTRADNNSNLARTQKQQHTEKSIHGGNILCISLLKDKTLAEREIQNASPLWFDLHGQLCTAATNV